MGHDLHFLERVTRASARQTDLAMRLYRDSSMVRHILNHAHLKNATDRIALSLHEEDNGPYVIVNKDGRFITCLGEGMSCKDTPIINYERLKTILDRRKKTREQIEDAISEYGDNVVDRLLTPIMTKGRSISREDFNQAATIQPVMRSRILSFYFRIAANNLLDQRDLARIGTLGKKQDPMLKRFYENLYAISALLPLFTLGGVKGVESVLMDADEIFSQTISSPITRAPMLHFAARAVWSVARLGRFSLKKYKDYYRHTNRLVEWIDALICLLAIAHRNSKYRAQIEKTIFRFKTLPKAALSFIGEDLEPLATLLVSFFKNPDYITSSLVEYTQKWFYEDSLEDPDDENYRFDSPDQVPGDLSLSYYSNYSIDLTKNVKTLSSFISLIPWLCETKAENLFLPQNIAENPPYKWHPSLSVHCLNIILPYDFHSHEITICNTTKKVGRNAPCPCGSGKKYKKCCLKKGTVDTAQSPRIVDEDKDKPGLVHSGKKYILHQPHVRYRGLS